MSSDENTRESTPSPYDDIPGRNSADFMLRTMQQHHVAISQMADTKANILITVSSIILTVAISQLGNEQMKWALLALTVFTLTALLLSIVAVLPKMVPVELEEKRLKRGYNIMFFGHFQALDKEIFDDELADILKYDGRIYEALGEDVYAMGKYLYRWKYRYLRFAYLSLLTGFVVASILGMIASLMG